MTIERLPTGKTSPRIPLQLGIEFRRNYARQMVKGTLRNISLTGAFVETGTIDLQSADKLVLTLSVGGRRRKISATVIWKNQDGCGVRFKPFNNRDVQIVDDLMYFVENSRDTKRSVFDDIIKRVY